VGGLFTLEVGNRAAEAAAETQERDLRRIAYTEFLDATDNYSAAAAARGESCVAGSDEAREWRGTCAPRQDEYQATRHAFQGEVNDMQLIASVDALRLVSLIAAVLPPANIGLSGEPTDEEIDRAAFDGLYSAFLRIAACDTSPDPRGDCGSTRAAIAQMANSFELDR
jgi:hypothetical protein